MGDELALPRHGRCSRPNDRRRQRQPRLHHRPRLLGSRAGADERRAGADGRHVGRVDRDAHGHPRAAGGRARRGAVRLLPARGARSAGAAGVRAEDLDLVIVATVTPDMSFPATAAIVADQLGASEGGRLRPLGRVHGIRLRDRAGVRDARAGCRPPRARRRRRPPLEGRGLESTAPRACCSATERARL